ncbi:hypothetical protein [Clostridium tarantellae]|uniref:Uncharacterized protein n=1 Tax=Clostridium tarantellae TaxID=39493 RepID=A0A6I1MMS2_9CLOT|nr:hypothetical protein [Clostridium tarantellae]MPQ43542.1 hypothetical protein [Clostridium tarantellae]
MYIVFGNRVVDSKDIKENLEKNSLFKVIKDMSKGSKREDIVAFNLSISLNILNEILMEDYNLDEVEDDELFNEYITLAEELATDLEEFIPEDSIFDIRAYKWDPSDNDIKVVILLAHEELGKNKLKDVMKRLLTQVE